MDKIMAIYKEGESHLQTTVHNGYCDYTARNGGDNLTVEEYLEKLGPDFSCVPLDEALDKIHEVEEKTYIELWEEIKEEDYTYWLEVLPPEKWKTVKGVNIFRMSEYIISNITRHCATVNDRYFTALRRTSEQYSHLADEIMTLV